MSSLSATAQVNHPAEYSSGTGRARAAAPRGIDAALDLAGTDEAIEVSLAFVGDRARIATIAAFARGLHAGINFLGGAPGAAPRSATPGAWSLPTHRQQHSRRSVTPLKINSAHYSRNRV